MTSNQTPPTDAIFSGRAEIPENVVFRKFPAETVLLNLNTGRYHGVNPTGGFMLELLQSLGSVREVAATVAAEYGLSPEEAAADVSAFCLELEQRGLIVLHHSA